MAGFLGGFGNAVYEYHRLFEVGKAKLPLDRGTLQMPARKLEEFVADVVFWQWRRHERSIPAFSIQ